MEAKNIIAEPTNDKRKNFSNLFYKYGLYLVFVVLIIFFTSINKNFLSVNNFRNLLQQTSSSCIAAAGLVFVLLTGGIDISISSIMYIVAVLSATLTGSGQLNFFTAILMSLIVGSLIGTINGWLVAKMKMPPLIVTLSMTYIIRGIGVGIVGIQTIMFNSDVGKFIVKTRLFGIIPLIVLMMIIILIIIQFILSRTLFGRQFFAIGNNRIGAEKIGIPVEKRIWAAYIICGAMAGLAGLVSGAQVGMVSPTFANGQEFIIISATVLGGVSLFGGKGSAFPNAFLGVLIIMCIENGLVMAKTNMYAYTIVRGCIIFMAVMLDSMRNKGETR